MSARPPSARPPCPASWGTGPGSHIPGHSPDSGTTLAKRRVRCSHSGPGVGSGGPPAPPTPPGAQFDPFSPEGSSLCAWRSLFICSQSACSSLCFHFGAYLLPVSSTGPVEPSTPTPGLPHAPLDAPFSQPHHVGPGPSPSSPAPVPRAPRRPTAGLSHVCSGHREDQGGTWASVACAAPAKALGGRWPGGRRAAPPRGWCWSVAQWVSGRTVHGCQGGCQRGRLEQAGRFSPAERGWAVLPSVTLSSGPSSAGQLLSSCCRLWSQPVGPHQQV